MTQIITTPEDRIGAQLMDYISKKTNLAVLLTGNWGSGKTHYIKNTFFSALTTKTTYKPVIISLFGVNSINDVKEKLMTELYPMLENKYIKAGTPIFKAVVKAVDVTRFIGQGLFESTIDTVSEVIKTKRLQKRDALNLAEIVIIFDDLERANPALLSENQLLGYVNGLTEDQVKVIIIANEEKLDKEVYQYVKEKTIGTTIHFRQSFDDTFLAILAASELENSYLKFLNENKNTIRDFLTKENKQQINYRTLNYFVVYFYEVAHFVQSGIGIHELDRLKAEILYDLLRFSLCITIEFKRGRIDFMQNQNLNDNTRFAIRKLYDTDTVTPMDIGEEIMQDYFPEDDFHYFQSVFSYLTGGDLFDKLTLVKELKQKYHIIDEQISESYKIFNRLSSARYFEQSDAEIVSDIRKMRTYALAGQYLARDYQSVFYFILRDGNLLNLNPEKLCKSFEAILKKTGTKQPYDPLMQRYLSYSGEGEYAEKYSRLKRIALDLNKRAGELENRQIDLKWQYELKHDYEKLHHFLLSEINKPYGRATLSGVSPRIFFSVFKTANNLQKQRMITLYHVLYNNHRGNTEKEDYDFAVALEKYIIQHLSKHPAKNASGNLILQLKNQIESHKKALAYTVGVLPE